jgi:signal peptidase II
MGMKSPIEHGPTLPWLLLLSGLIVVFDQLSKLLVVSQLDYGVASPVFTGFDLLLVHNTGAAFSFLSSAGGWQRWILTGISALVSLGILAWLWRLPRQNLLLGLALASILGGALGNLYDRWVFGYVIDFISIYVGDWRFATFNIADAAISIGAALMALDIFREGRRHD